MRVTAGDVRLQCLVNVCGRSWKVGRVTAGA